MFLSNFCPHDPKHLKKCHIEPVWMRQGRGLPFCAPGKKSHFRPFCDCIKSGNYTTSSSINERRRGGGGHYDYFPFLRSAFALLSIYVRYFVYLLRSVAGLGTVFFTHPEIPLSSIKQQYLACFNVANFKESYRIHGAQFITLKILV